MEGSGTGREGMDGWVRAGLAGTAQNARFFSHRRLGSAGPGPGRSFGKGERGAGLGIGR